jgi:KDO2-lipid IV(A) lauroyltransferase
VTDAVTTPEQSQHLPRKLLAPRYWPSWLGAGVLWCVAQLPYRIAIRIGEAIGMLLYPLIPRRRHIVAVNLRICFPTLSEPERRALARKNFRYTGRTLVEMALAWWAPPSTLPRLAHFHGLEHLRSAQARGRGVLLVGGHFTPMEMAARLTGLQTRFDTIYRRNNNPVFEYLTARFRQCYYGMPIPRDDIRALVRRLRQGHTVWYAPDQDYGRRHAVFVPFFGTQAATMSATSRIARMSGATVLSVTFYGRDDASGYDITFLPPPENYPSDNPEADAARLNGFFEDAVRRAPEQYLWVHRRFKTRPNRADPKLY